MWMDWKSTAGNGIKAYADRAFVLPVSLSSYHFHTVFVIVIVDSSGQRNTFVIGISKIGWRHGRVYHVISNFLTFYMGKVAETRTIGSLTVIMLWLKTLSHGLIRRKTFHYTSVPVGELFDSLPLNPKFNSILKCLG